MELDNRPDTDPTPNAHHEPDATAHHDEYDEPSAFERFAWVFYAPSDAFAGLTYARRGPIIAWGLVILMLAALVSTMLTMARPDLVRQQIEMQIEPLREQYEAGEISKQDFERATSMMQQSEGAGFQVIGAIGSLISTVLISLLVAMVFLPVAKLLEGGGGDTEYPIGYGVVLGVFLIASMISSLGRVIESMGIYLTENLRFALDASPLVDQSNIFAFMMLKNLGPFPIWWMIVMGIGLSVITGADRMRSILIVVGVWLGLMVIFGGLAQFMSNLM